MRHDSANPSPFDQCHALSDCFGIRNILPYFGGCFIDIGPASVGLKNLIHVAVTDFGVVYDKI